MTPSMQTIQVASNSSKPDDGEALLLTGVRAGDEKACEELVRRYGGRMLAVARRFFDEEQDAADSVQEAFLSAFKSIHGFAGNSRLGTWLHRIVVNACLMRRRSERRRATVSIDELQPTFDDSGHHAGRISPWRAAPDQLAQAAELRERVRACIDRLPDRYRLVILLRDIEELDTQETAKRLGIDANAVKVRLHRARHALRALLDPHVRQNVEEVESALPA